MIPLIRYGESPKNPTPVQKPVEANSIAAGRPATEDISFTGQKLPLSCHSLLRLLRLSYSPGPVTADRRPRQEFELIFGADVRNYRQSCRPLVHAARPSVHPSRCCCCRCCCCCCCCRCCRASRRAPPGNKWATIILSTRGTMETTTWNHRGRRHGVLDIG